MTGSTPANDENQSIYNGIQRFKIQMSKTRSERTDIMKLKRLFRALENLNFEFVSNFDIRISDFPVDLSKPLHPFFLEEEDLR